MIRGRRVGIGAVAVALGTAVLAGACSRPSQDHVAATCRHAGDLLRTLADSGSQRGRNGDLSPIVNRVADAARSSGEPALREPAERLWDAWQASQSDNEAAPTLGFGRAANDLAEQCTDRGFTYPDIGFD